MEKKNDLKTDNKPKLESGKKKWMRPEMTIIKHYKTLDGSAPATEEDFLEDTMS